MRLTQRIRSLGVSMRALCIDDVGEGKTSEVAMLFQCILGT